MSVDLKRKTVSIMKAQEVAGVSRRTIYNWLNARKLDYFRTAGGNIRIYLDSLFRDENNQPTTVVGDQPLRSKNFIHLSS